MFQYLIRRLLWAAVLFIGVTLITYVLFFLLPADPARLAAGKSATAEDVARVEHQLGLDRPVHEQYGLFLKRLVVDHSLGRSYANRRSVNEMIGEAVPVTAALVVRRRDPLDADRAADRDHLGAQAAVADRQGDDDLHPRSGSRRRSSGSGSCCSTSSASSGA